VFKAQRLIQYLTLAKLSLRPPLLFLFRLQSGCLARACLDWLESRGVKDKTGLKGNNDDGSLYGCRFYFSPGLLICNSSDSIRQLLPDLWKPLVPLLDTGHIIFSSKVMVLVGAALAANCSRARTAVRG
jgi:hypothetical protein